jgi:hypothetical protein
MFAIILSLFSSIRQGSRSRAALRAEVLALYRRLFVQHRSSRAHELGLSAAARSVLGRDRTRGLPKIHWNFGTVALMPKF